MKISLKILGVGGGSAKVLHNQCSTAWVLMVDDAPVLLFDLGLGVTYQYQKYFPELPTQLYISHNHTDHSGELPVFLAIQRADKVSTNLIAHTAVMDKLIKHRLDELRSTGKHLDEFCDYVPLTGGQQYDLGKNLFLEPIEAKHAETCYGAVIYYEDQPIIGWSADSGFHEELYDKLLEASVCLIDARVKGNTDHASFQDFNKYLQHKQALSNIYVVGYGRDFTSSNFYHKGYPGQEIIINL